MSPRERLETLILSWTLQHGRPPSAIEGVKWAGEETEKVYRKIEKGLMSHPPSLDGIEMDVSEALWSLAGGFQPPFIELLSMALDPTMPQSKDLDRLLQVFEVPDAAEAAVH